MCVRACEYLYFKYYCVDVAHFEGFLVGRVGTKSNIMRHRCYSYMQREGEGDGEREGKEREEDLFMTTSCIHNEFNTADVR